MAELNVNQNRRVRRIRHRGRSSQVLIYLGKQLRFFINQSDWIMLPLAAIIAALVSMVIHEDFFHNMEGNLMGAFALTCVAIWNGCFNSIQAVCRERAIIKREHRSGMHISSYVAAHMIYQLGLCIIQSGVSVYVMLLAGVQFPSQGFLTPLMMLDIFISMLLISYAADMMSLLISSLSHTTTGAMTVMPFVLIFQLIFSGGIIPLPGWSKPLSDFTISNYGIKAIAAQSGYNEKPMVTAWNTIEGLRNYEVGGTFTYGNVLDLLESPGLEKYRDTVVVKSYTVGDAAEAFDTADQVFHLREQEIAQPVRIRDVLDFIVNSNMANGVRDLAIIPDAEGSGGLTVGTLLQLLLSDEDSSDLLDGRIGSTITLDQVFSILHLDEKIEEAKDQVLNEPMTLSQVLDFIRNNESLQAKRDQTFTIKFTVGDVIDLLGEEDVKALVQQVTADAAYKPEYESTPENVQKNWIILGGFALLFALLSVIVLEMIDKDKR